MLLRCIQSTKITIASRSEKVKEMGHFRSILQLDKDIKVRTGCYGSKAKNIPFPAGRYH